MRTSLQNSLAIIIQNEEDYPMTIGPLQLVLVKFADEKRTLPVSQALKAVRRTGLIRLVDLLFVYKNLEGVIQSKEISDLPEASKAEYGIILQGLLGIRAAHKTEGNVDQITAAMSLSPGDFGLNSEQVQKLAADLPNGGLAMLAIFEHTWAIELKEALLNAGGELVAQGLISPEAMALGGTTLEEAVASAKKIEEEAATAAATGLADADAKLAQAHIDAEAKIAEAQRVLDEADAQAAVRLDQAKMVAAAAIAAGVRTAAGQMEEADQHLEQSKLEAEQTVALGKEQAAAEVEEGIQTAKRIKQAATLEALKILVEAHLIKREAAREAISTLTDAAMLEQGSEAKSYKTLFSENVVPK
jgi:uncharacterized membrane protein